MNSSTLRFATGSALQHNLNTFKTRYFPQKLQLYSQMSKKMKLKREKKKFKLDYSLGARQEPKKREGGNITLTVCGTGGYGTPRCLFLGTDRLNYIFNCGEGMQRSSQEHKFKLTRLQRAFITSCKWENIGGLIGLGLTIQSTGVSPPLKVHSPRQLESVLKESDQLHHVAHVHLEFEDWRKYKKYSDKAINLWHIPLRPDTYKHIEKDTDCTTESEIKANGKRIINDDHSQRKVAKLDGESFEAPSKEVLCYVCKLKDRSGSLNLIKCVEYGVKPGPLLGKLKSGEDITLEDGTIVHSSDVCEATIRGPTFIVVDVPSKAYLTSFLNDKMLQKYQNTDVAYIFHFTPKEILLDPCYIEWLNKFGSKTQHILIDAEYCTMSTEAVIKNQYMLNLIHPKVFPCLPHVEENTEDDRNIKITDKEGNTLTVSVAKALEDFYLFPKMRRCEEHIIKVHKDEYVNDCMKLEGFQNALTKVHHDIDLYTKSLDTECAEYPKLLMLGTGCSVPCKYRNTSGILLQPDENNNILLDCGEGILGQLQRHSTRPQYESILRNLRGVFISHLHADHHLGLFSILAKRATLTQEPIYIIAPEIYLEWMRHYSTCVEQILNNVRFYSNDYVHVDESLKNLQQKTDLFEHLNISQLCTTKVPHPGCASGVTIVLKNGVKITYSGDTMPSDNLVCMGAGSDLLIHEATMDDTLVDRAAKTFHTTTSQAIKVGQKMNAQFTLLTHFSQRYAKLPYIGNNVNGQCMNSVGVAFDFMEISLWQLKLLPTFYPALMIMFAESTTESKQRAEKQKLKACVKEVMEGSG